MRRPLILLLILSIAISLAIVTYAVFSSSTDVPTSTVSGKVFDVSATSPSSITEPRYIEQTPVWLFWLGNSVAPPVNSDLLLDVTLNTSAPAGLQVALYDDNDQQLAIASISGTAAQLTVLDLILQGQTGQQLMSLRFFYNGNPISPSNTPFSPSTTSFSVLASTDMDMVDLIITQYWVLTVLQPVQQGNDSTEFSSFMQVAATGFNYQPYRVARCRTGTIKMVYSHSAATFYLYLNGSLVNANSTFTNIDTSQYTAPDDVLFVKSANFNAQNNLYITDINLNGTSHPGTYLSDHGSEQTLLLSGFQPDANGDFEITFTYVSSGRFNQVSNCTLSVYVSSTS